MKWGRLHGFALDCIRYVKQSDAFDIITIVDSDQLALRSGYAEFLGQDAIANKRFGLLTHVLGKIGRGTWISPAEAAYQEFELWRPFLRRFPGGEENFVHWTFWPGTVISAEGAFALLDLFDNDVQLQRILHASQMWATEEVLFPTFMVLLGFSIQRNPCTNKFVKFRTSYTPHDVETALRHPNAFWIHPVPRQYDDPVRAHLRQRYEEYCRSSLGCAAPLHRDQIWPILRTMRTIDGWLEDDEAELLAIAVREALACGAQPKTIVEIGAYCGKATFVLASVAKASAIEARIVAIDTFDGVVGALDRGLFQNEPTLDKFKRMIKATGLERWVEPRVGRPATLPWNQPIDLLVVDGFHDYASVAQDFYAFQKWLPAGALVAFHDYAEYFPGVRAFVDELIAFGEWEEVAQANSMKLLRRQSAKAKTIVIANDCANWCGEEVIAAGAPCATLN